MTYNTHVHTRHKTGSESSIVYSNGRAHQHTNISNLVRQLRRHSNKPQTTQEPNNHDGPDTDNITGASPRACTKFAAGHTELLAFDVSVLKSLPSSSFPHFATPQMFRHFHNDSAVAATLVSPVLSVAGVGTGE